jgi:hypothetical protein
MLLKSHRIVVDWIEVELHLRSASNAPSVKRAVDALTNRDQYVTALNPGAGGAATKFQFRLQDVAALRSLADYFESCWSGCEALITGLEVALDTYIPGATLRALAECLDEQFRWMEYPSDGQWHLYRTPEDKPQWLMKGEGVAQTDLIAALADQWQLTDFNKNTTSAPTRFHLHVKTTDANKRPLPPKLWRARFEVTLHGSSLPWTNVRELVTADFTLLQKWFRFRRQDPAAPAHLVSALRSRHLPAGLQLGKSGNYARPPKPGGVRRRGKPNKFRSVALADTRMNELVYDKLRRLGGSADMRAT